MFCCTTRPLPRTANARSVTSWEPSRGVDRVRAIGTHDFASLEAGELLMDSQSVLYPLFAGHAGARCVAEERQESGSELFRTKVAT